MTEWISIGNIFEVDFFTIRNWFDVLISIIALPILSLFMLSGIWWKPIKWTAKGWNETQGKSQGDSLFNEWGWFVVSFIIWPICLLVPYSVLMIILNLFRYVIKLF